MQKFKNIQVQKQQLLLIQQNIVSILNRIRILLQIPGHVGIKGNELADFLRKHNKKKLKAQIFLKDKRKQNLHICMYTQTYKQIDLQKLPLILPLVSRPLKNQLFTRLHLGHTLLTHKQKSETLRSKRVHQKLTCSYCINSQN